MSKLVDDVKSGLRGIRGAGDALRGSVLEAADQTVDNNPSHPETAASRWQNREIKEKGKADLSDADQMIARREAEHRTGGATADTGYGGATAPGTSMAHDASTTPAASGDPSTTRLAESTHATTNAPAGNAHPTTAAATGSAHPPAKASDGSGYVSTATPAGTGTETATRGI